MKILFVLLTVGITACSSHHHALKENPHNNRYDALFKEALNAFQRGSIVKSQQLLNETLSRNGGIHPEAAILKARISLREGNIESAKSILSDQIALIPHDSELHETLASVYFFEKDYDKAKEALRKSRRLGAPMFRVAYHLGLIAEQENYLENAKKLFNQVIDLNPESNLANLSANRIKAIDVNVIRLEKSNTK